MQFDGVSAGAPRLGQRVKTRFDAAGRSACATAVLLAMTGLVAGQGVQIAAVENISPDGAATPNSFTSAIRPGGLLRVTVPASSRPGRVQLLLGNDPVQVTRRQRVNGADQLIARVPLKAVEGCYVPLRVLWGGTLLADSAGVAVSRSGVCQPAAFQPANSWLSKKIGIAARIHSTEWSLETGAGLNNVDIVSALFEGDSAALRPGPMLRFPPPGLCSSQHRTYVRGTPTIEILLPLLFEEVNGIELDGGDFLNLDDGGYQMQIPRVVGHAGLFWKTVATSQQEYQPLKTNGNLNLREPGGGAVSPFVAALGPPASFEWLKRPASPVISLKGDATVEWKAAAPGVVLVAVIAVDPGHARFSYCLCVAPPAESRFPIPRALLGSLVTSTSAGRESAGAVYLIHIPDKPGAFSSPQLETTAVLSMRMLTAKVLLRR